MRKRARYPEWLPLSERPASKGVVLSRSPVILSSGDPPRAYWCCGYVVFRYLAKGAAYCPETVPTPNEGALNTPYGTCGRTRPHDLCHIAPRREGSRRPLLYRTKP
jgi:hypothetical protein